MKVQNFHCGRQWKRRQRASVMYMVKPQAHTAPPSFMLAYFRPRLNWRQITLPGKTEDKGWGFFCCLSSITVTCVHQFGSESRIIMLTLSNAILHVTILICVTDAFPSKSWQDYEAFWQKSWLFFFWSLLRQVCIMHSTKSCISIWPQWWKLLATER